MKKYVLLFIFCLLIFELKLDSYAADAVGVSWLNQMSGSMRRVDVDSLFSVEIRNISVDHWLLVGYEDVSSGFLMISDQSFTVDLRFGLNSFGDWRNYTSSPVGDNLYYLQCGGIAGLGLNLEWDVPFFRGSFDALKRALVNFSPSLFEGFPAPDYVFDSNLGYLTGIAERSSILDIVDHESVKFPWSSTNVDDRIFKFGWGSSTSTGIDLHYGTRDGLVEYKDLKIQAVLRLRGYYINFMTGSKTGLLPEENNIYEFPLIQPYDPYSLSFNFDNLDAWFADFLAEIDENSKLLEKPLMYGDLYLRVVGSTISRVNDPVYPVAGPWTCLQFTVISQLGDADNDIFIAGGTFDDDGAFIPDSSSPFGSGQNIQIGTGSGFSESDASNNIVQPNTDPLFDNLSDLFKQIDKLPTVIASLFSFLPSWCLALFATAFSLSIVVLIWKVAT